MNLPMSIEPRVPEAPARPKYAEYGIDIVEKGETTEVFKHGKLIGSYTIDIERLTLRFSFPHNKFFNYFAYLACDRFENRIEWVNENLRKDTLDQLQAGVAFLGFQRFEEKLAEYVTAVNMVPCGNA